MKKGRDVRNKSERPFVRKPPVFLRGDAEFVERIRNLFAGHALNQA